MNVIPNSVLAVLGENVASSTPVGGGSIATTTLLEMCSGRKYLLKQNVVKGAFRCEVNGLCEIKMSNTIRTPDVLFFDDDFLLLEFIESGQKNNSFFNVFGRRYGQMHRFESGYYGFEEDNYIGRSKQKNPKVSIAEVSWFEYYFENRLLYQYKLAERKGYVNDDLKVLFLVLESKIASIFAGSEEDPVLLHGDLWGGNYLCDLCGQPVLIDPAVYYGHREADIAMTYLFGGFTKEFYDGYNEVNPLKEGVEYRMPVYLLYHLFNHLNLFGKGYLGQIIHILKSYS